MESINPCAARRVSLNTRLTTRINTVIPSKACHCSASLLMGFTLMRCAALCGAFQCLPRHDFPSATTDLAKGGRVRNAVVNVKRQQTPDARESISVCLERYEGSKQLQHILPNLPSLMLYQTTEEKYFTLQMMNSATNQLEPYKICVAFFKENSLMRIHVLSAFFARTGPGAPGEHIPQKPVSLFKVANIINLRIIYHTSA
ncbi:hypothetical protein [Citrobacter youngae]|uniref:hypothetical protein n=1 Tax=Citrobacter youngae TaxID=133448 RepID=UPI003EDE91B4